MPDPRPSRALSFQWPWPLFMTALPDAYRKLVENRKKPLPIGRRQIWMHVSLRPPRRAYVEAVRHALGIAGVPGEFVPAYDHGELPPFGRIPYGCIVGLIEFGDYLGPHLPPRPPGHADYDHRVRSAGDQDRWRMPGQHGYEVVRYQSLTEPIPCKGQLGIWRIPSDVLARLPETETDR